ncbi:Glycosyltransferase [hydrothermal vent metagenome]|uniref:Glycosyltransferase n=1 Tax=hydrothermal vent metagenome TaxID=652676 RepID=A0A3B1D4Z6_9ZZZZ
MTKRQTRAIILFARDPVAGRVKTRLAPFLNQDLILELYTRFLNDSIDKICQIKTADPFIGVHPSDSSGYFSRASANQEHSPAVFLQEGEDLGEKMFNAFKSRFDEGYEHVVIIGSDSPSLPVAYIETALNSEKDLVIGPSTDGGYYLIGMYQNPVNVFADGIEWGSEKVLRQTLDRIENHESSLELLPPWYDVDRAEDLKFLKTHLELIAHTGNGDVGTTGELLKGLDI